MDEVWSNTVRRLEAELDEYRLLRERHNSENDPGIIEEISHALADAKAALDRKYSQLIAFAAGLSDDCVDFDTDLNVGAIVVSRRGSVSYIFGPESLSSSEPFFSPELSQFIADQIAANGPTQTATVPGSTQQNPRAAGHDAEQFAMSIASSLTADLARSSIESADADRFAERLEALYSGISNSTNSDTLNLISRCLEFAGHVQCLRDIHCSNSTDTPSEMPKVDFEYLS